MPRDSSLYLHDILRAISRIEALTEGMGQGDFTTNNLQVDGVLYNLMTIGEAVKSIPDQVREQYPTIRWRDIGRFRDRVVHHYFLLDFTIIWEIVSEHLPQLKVAVEELLQAGENDENEEG